MFEELKEGFIKFITSRITILAVLLAVCALGLVWRLFHLQLVHGQEYLDSFQLMIKKERVVPGVRGNIYDRNGNLLAYNELTYSVTIEDVFDDGWGHNRNLNNSVNLMIEIVERNGDRIEDTFPITLDENGMFVFELDGTRHLRFLADLYTDGPVEDLEYRDRIKSAQEVIDDLAVRYGVGDYADPEDADTFVPGLGYENERLLKIIMIRYAMSLNNFQKYMETTVAVNVNDKTVAEIQENGDAMPGVLIQETTRRRYVDSYYFSQIIGYTGKVSADELEALQTEDSSYNMNDIVGKAGIEQSMEGALRGENGSETLFVDKMGKVIALGDVVSSLAGNHVYLTIDKDLQKAAYDLLESRIAGILTQRIENVRVVPDDMPTQDLIIPIYDVYYALFRNSIIDISHFTKADAKETEQAVQQVFSARLNDVLARLEDEFRNTQTPYNQLTQEYKVYQTFISSMLYNDGILNSDLVDRNDETYIAWTTDEVISLTAFLKHCIAQNWVDVTLLNLEDPYSDAETVFDAIVRYSINRCAASSDFQKRLYRYLIDDDVVTGRDVCNLLIEQNVIQLGSQDLEAWNSHSTDAYHFLVERITNLEITPAQLALDPCAGSMVITDVNTGDVIACASYPSYDNNRIPEASYFAALQNDLSRPLYNYATQQRTAPGSTFKMVSATAGLCEGVISTSDSYVCKGEFDLITPSPRCWAYPGAHGFLTVTPAIRHSCNCFFYNVAYYMGFENGRYNPDKGIERLAHYADLYGLSEKTGVEIAEADPSVSDTDAVRSAIGQGTAGYTTIGLARYATTLANNGTCYNLTMIDKVTDNDDVLVYDNQATVRNTIDMSGAYWNAIHEGMRGSVQNQPYWVEADVNVAGKTGTAEESKSRGDHALFISYAPYENPEIAIAVRVAFGYTSGYTSQIAKDMYKYIYNDPSERESILSNTARELDSQAVND